MNPPGECRLKRRFLFRRPAFRKGVQGGEVAFDPLLPLQKLPQTLLRLWREAVNAFVQFS